MSEHELREEISFLYRLVKQLADELHECRHKHHHHQVLSFIRIVRLQGGKVMAESPITLTVGQTAEFTVVGFDQNGNPFNGPIPTPAWAIDNATLDSIVPDPNTPTNEDATSLVAGTANLSAQVTNAQGTVLSDSQPIINTAPQILSSIKIQQVQTAAQQVQTALKTTVANS
jgi:hypothetical protein